MTERQRQRDGQRDPALAAASGPRPALFVDRDGTLIVDVGYPRDPALVEPLPGAISALRELGARFALVIISNQSGIGRGLITEAEARAVHDRVIEVFAREGVAFAGAYYCPHAPEASCSCRKPAPGLLLDAARELGLDLATSVMIGDKASDVTAGLAAGCRHIIRFGPDTDGADGSQRCDDWASVTQALRSLA
jgi:D-glycero-D-manno-heptose 1,7-bisphosphate phosphatase